MVPAHWPASSSPAGVQSPLLPALPYILCRRWACYPPDTIALLVSSLALQSVCMGAVCHCCVIARLQAGVRPARLPQSFRGAEFSSCGAERVPRKCRVSPPPLSLPHIRCTTRCTPEMLSRNGIGMCAPKSKKLERFLVSHILDNPEKMRTEQDYCGWSIPLPGPAAQCPVHICRSIQRPGVPEPSTLKTRHRHRKQSASQLSKSPHPTQASQTRPRQQSVPD